MGILCLETWLFGIKPIVLVPVGILVPTPLTRRPRLLAKEVLQVGAELVCMRWRYSSESVVGSTTMFMAASACMTVMMLAAVE